MKPQTFEEFLQDKHAQLFPTLLDDSAPDHFDDWLGDLNADEFITYADAYGAEITKTPLALLSVAKCPACDGSGGIPYQVADDEWEQEQCQWCHERSLYKPKA